MRKANPASAILSIGFLSLLIGVSLYVVFSNPSGLVLDRQAEPVSEWYRFKLRVIGIRFYESQLLRYEKAAELHQWIVLRQDERVAGLEQMHNAGSENSDYDLARAELLENEAEMIRAKAVRDSIQEQELSYLEELGTTIEAIHVKLDEARPAASQ